MKSSAHLTISGKTLECESVVATLAKCGIDCNVSKNVSIVGGKIEPGCMITKTFNQEKEIQNLWSTCRRTFDLKCAHLNIAGSYDGCVWGFVEKKECPASESFLKTLSLPTLEWTAWLKK